MQKVIEQFHLTGRGIVVVVPNPTSLPVGTELQATVVCPDGSQFSAPAFKEWLLRHASTSPVEHEAYLLRGISKEQLPEGATIEVYAL